MWLRWPHELLPRPLKRHQTYDAAPATAAPVRTAVTTAPSLRGRRTSELRNQSRAPGTTPRRDRHVPRLPESGTVSAMPRMRRAKGGRRQERGADARTVEALSPKSGKTERSVKERQVSRGSHHGRAGPWPRKPATMRGMGECGGNQGRRAAAAAQSAGAPGNRGIRLPWIGRATTGTRPLWRLGALPDLRRPAAAAGGRAGVRRERRLRVGTHAVTVRARLARAPDWTGPEARTEGGGRGAREGEGERRANDKCRSLCRPRRLRAPGKWSRARALSRSLARACAFSLSLSLSLSLSDPYRRLRALGK